MDTKYQDNKLRKEWAGKFLAEVDDNGKPYLIRKITNPKTKSGNVTLDGERTNLNIDYIIDRVSKGDYKIMSEKDVYLYNTEKFFKLYSEWKEMVELMRKNLYKYSAETNPTFLDSMKNVIKDEFGKQWINFDMVVYDKKVLNETKQYFKNAMEIKNIWSKYGYDGNGIN